MHNLSTDFLWDFYKYKIRLYIHLHKYKRTQFCFLFQIYIVRLNTTLLLYNIHVVTFYIIFRILSNLIQVSIQFVFMSSWKAGDQAYFERMIVQTWKKMVKILTGELIQWLHQNMGFLQKKTISLCVKTVMIQKCFFFTWLNYFWLYMIKDFHIKGRETQKGPFLKFQYTDKI